MFSVWSLISLYYYTCIFVIHFLQLLQIVYKTLHHLFLETGLKREKEKETGGERETEDGEEGERDRDAEVSNNIRKVEIKR